MHVSIIDTSVFYNILNIPKRNDKYTEVKDELRTLQDDKQQTLILPFATIIETGNHIAHIADGNVRRERAGKMAELIRRIAKDEAPWTYYGREFEREDLLDMSQTFIVNAGVEIGIGDLSIIQVYKKYKETVPAIGSILDIG